LEVGSWKLEVGSWKLEVGSWKLEVGSWKLEVGSWKFTVQHIVAHNFTMENKAIYNSANGTLV